eukprot:9200645-Pyramimonas_sp.AAC.1
MERTLERVPWWQQLGQEREQNAQLLQKTQDHLERKHRLPKKPRLPLQADQEPTGFSTPGT